MTRHGEPDRKVPGDDLVTAAKTDRQAFGRLFDHFYPPILAYCMRRLLVRAVAEDVCSDVFLRVAGQIGTFGGSTLEDFRRWLFRIATNEINAQLRKSLRRRDLLEAAARLGTIRTDITTQVIHDSRCIDWDDVYHALCELSDREQSMITLRFFTALKHDQIAEVLDLKPGTVRTALSRALNKLRERLLSDRRKSSVPGPAGGNN